MGFKLDRTYVLEFEGDMQGAVVKIRATSVGTLKKIGESDAAELAALLADHVLEWNLEDRDGKPLPVTAEALIDNAEEVILAALIREWYKAAVGLTAPLDVGSTGIGKALEQTISMELAKKSPANSTSD